MTKLRNSIPYSLALRGQRKPRVGAVCSSTSRGVTVGAMVVEEGRETQKRHGDPGATNHTVGDLLLDPPRSPGVDETQRELALLMPGE